MPEFTNSNTPSASESTTPASPSLAANTTRGVAWMMLQTVGVQVVNLGSIIALGWLLKPESFALFAYVTTISTLVAISKQFGLNTVIIHRYNRFRVYCNPAVWMTLALGLFATLMMIAAAPIAAAVYEDPELTGLVVIFAIGMLPEALTTVPESALAAQMRFKLLATVQFTWSTLLVVLMVVFALLGFEAYSFVLPQPIVQVLRLAIVWRAARPRIRRSPQFRRWRFLVGDSVTISIGSMAYWVVNQCDYVILGLSYHSDAMVGLYFFGFRVGTRVVVLFQYSLRRVLMPAFAGIKHDPDRQRQAFVRATRVLAAIAAPICAMQILMAEPFFALLLPADKQGAAGIVEIMSLTSFFMVIRPSSASLMQAQGRFRTVMSIDIVLALLFIPTVAIGAFSGDIETVAWIVAANAFASSIITIGCALAPSPRLMKATAMTICGILATIAVIIACGLWLRQFLPAHPLWTLLTAPVFVLLAYLPLTWAVRPDLIRELRLLTHMLAERFLKPREIRAR